MTHPIPDYPKTRVLVVGDVMLDKYWHGSTSRISPEAPVPVVHINQEQALPGGAANVALNIQSLGSSVSLLSLTGDDSLADTLENYLNARQIQTVFQRIKNHSTISKIRVLSLHQQLIRLDFEKKLKDSNNSHASFIIKNYQKLIGKNNINAIVLSDYKKGVLSEASELIKLANHYAIPVFVDPKGSDYSIYKNAFLLTPNRKEFEQVVGRCESDQDFVKKGLKLIKDLNLNALLITRGENGMSLIQRHKPALHLKAQKQEVYDVTGAGDTVIGVLAASVGAGTALEEAVKLSNMAAGIVVTKLGAGAVTPAELRRAFREEHNIQRGVMTEAELIQAIHDAHAHGETVVMTNGCFDILHPGHVYYLEEAKKLGDHLIVAVNTDKSVRKLKGDSRPINPVQSRMQVLAGLASVDWVVSFNEDTPQKLIKKLLPDVLVKGGDWRVNQIVGHDSVLKNGGKVYSLSFVDNHSTSKIVEKIKQKR